jgi:hypothetical protein
MSNAAEAARLRGLKRAVTFALARFHKATPGDSGTDWRVGRLFRENVHHGRNVGDMDAGECLAALHELNGAGR